MITISQDHVFEDHKGTLVDIIIVTPEIRQCVYDRSNMLRRLNGKDLTDEDLKDFELFSDDSIREIAKSVGLKTPDYNCVGDCKDCRELFYCEVPNNKKFFSEMVLTLTADGIVLTKKEGKSYIATIEKCEDKLLYDTKGNRVYGLIYEQECDKHDWKGRDCGTSFVNINNYFRYCPACQRELRLDREECEQEVYEQIFVGE